MLPSPSKNISLSCCFYSVCQHEAAGTLDVVVTSVLAAVLRGEGYCAGSQRNAQELVMI